MSVNFVSFAAPQAHLHVIGKTTLSANDSRHFRLVRIFVTVWHNRELTWRLTMRDIEVRFRGSVLGILWVVLVPIYMLSLYTLVFGIIFRARWPGLEANSTLHVALLYFVALILNELLVECLNRAPILMFENVSFIKKVVFPVEILPFVIVGSSLFRVIISSTILIVFYLILEGIPPLSAITLPILLLPLTLLILGLVWTLSALGVYIRDLRQVVAVITPALMFASPTFFPLSAVPEPLRALLYINPLTFIIESARGALFFGDWPNWLALSGYTGVASLFALVGYYWFMRLRDGFADLV